MLTDDSTNPRQKPTKQNIVRISFVVFEVVLNCAQIQAMHWLVRDAKPNDSLFFHCAYHRFRKCVGQV